MGLLCLEGNEDVRKLQDKLAGHLLFQAGMGSPLLP